MQKLIIILVLLATGVITSQSNYEKGMQKAFELWGSNPIEASNLFERIAMAESENWLPSYYAAQINIVNSFGEQDKEKLTAQLGKAQELLNISKSISSNNPEILVMEAMLNTAWVAYDGSTYGMTLSPKISVFYAQAQQIAPNNPRVVLNKAEWAMGIGTPY